MVDRLVCIYINLKLIDVGALDAFVMKYIMNVLL